MRVDVRFDMLAPDLSTHKAINFLRFLWRKYPFEFQSMELLEPYNSVIEKPKQLALSEKINSLKHELERFQHDANVQGYNVDFESVMISLESHINTIKKYEDLENEKN